MVSVNELKKEDFLKKSKILLVALSALNVFSNVYATTHSSEATEIVYGEDNRVETYDAEANWQELAKSTAGMVEIKKILTVGKFSILPPGDLNSKYRLCTDEKFKNQPTAVTCSGFLVGNDLLVTAGHCVKNKKDCEEQAWVFDYAVKKETGFADMMIPSSKIVGCKEIISRELKGKGQDLRDFALIKLDRKLTDRKPLKFRTSGKIDDNAKLVVIGHPSGLPQKVADNANVFENTSDRFFLTNLDTFGGNSGSAVFNEETKEVEGILVRGAEDYKKDTECGMRVNVVDQNAPDIIIEEEIPVVSSNIILNQDENETQIVKKKPYGEAVSRITDVDKLIQ